MRSLTPLQALKSTYLTSMTTIAFPRMFVKLASCRQANQKTVKQQKSNQYMILPSRSRMWTDCPSDCSTLEYCLSGSLALVLASPAPVAWPSRCSGDECGKDADPRAHARCPPSNPPDSRLPGAPAFPLADGGGGTGTPRRGETDCERRRTPAPEGQLPPARPPLPPRGMRRARPSRRCRCCAAQLLRPVAAGRCL